MLLLAEDIAEEVIEIGKKEVQEDSTIIDEEEIIEDVLEDAVEDTLEDAIEDVVDESVDEDTIEDIAEDIAEEVIEIGEEITEEIVETPSETIEEIVEESIDDSDLTEAKALLEEIEESLEEEEKTAEDTLEAEVIEETKESVPLDDVLEYEEDKKTEEEKKNLLTLPTDEKPTLEDVPIIKMSRTILKIIIVGDEQVGKTTLQKSYSDIGFQTEYKEIIGADFASKHLEIDGENFALQMWDIIGQTRETINQDLFYKGTNGALLVFDVTRRDTFESIYQWYSDIKKYGSVEFVIIGNKIDLRTSEQDCVTTEQGQELANKLSSELDRPVHYFEANALDNENIEDAFKLLAIKTISIFKENIDR